MGDNKKIKLTGENIDRIDYNECVASLDVRLPVNMFKPNEAGNALGIDVAMTKIAYHLSTMTGVVQLTPPYLLLCSAHISGLSPPP